MIGRYLCAISSLTGISFLGHREGVRLHPTTLGDTKYRAPSENKSEPELVRIGTEEGWGNFSEAST